MSARALAIMIAFGAAGILLVAMTGGAQPSRASASASFNGLIAFASDRDGNLEIYTMLVDGTAQTRLTDTLTADDTSPSWSPDGRIAFATNRDGNWEIYTMQSDGSALFNVTKSPASDLDPSWSPDGTKIAFRSTRSGNSDLYVIAPDGSGLTNLTNDPMGEYDPAWTPDGTKLAFDRTANSDSDIWVTNAGRHRSDRSNEDHNNTRVRPGLVAGRHQDRLYPAHGRELRHLDDERGRNRARFS